MLEARAFLLEELALDQEPLRIIARQHQDLGGNLTKKIKADAQLLTTWQRLHDGSTYSFRPQELSSKVVDFYSLASEEMYEPSDEHAYLAKYLAGVHAGLTDSVINGSWWGSLLRRPILIAQLAQAEANLMLTSKGVMSMDHRDVLRNSKYVLWSDATREIVFDPRFYLGKVIALEYVLGRRAFLPTEIPAVPQNLAESLQISLAA